MAEVLDSGAVNARTDGEELGLALSRELTPTRFDKLDDLEPFRTFLDFCVKGTNHAAAHQAADLATAANAAEEAIASKAAEMLSTGRLKTFVRAVDGEFFRIPAAYWRGWHSFRPLAGAGFCADADRHGNLAGNLDGRPIFVEADQIRKIADQPEWGSMAAQPVNRRKTNKEPGWLPLLRKEMEARDKRDAELLLSDKPAQNWPKAPWFRTRLIKQHNIPAEKLATSTFRGWVSRLSKELGR